MAERRMFAKTIIDSDIFLDMPLSTQSLYFHLSMRADDEGFVNNAKKIMRIISANNNDLDILIAKAFVLSFKNSGVIVIKHWKLHNYIRKDRFKPTLYQEEKKQLFEKDNGSYTFTRYNNVMKNISNTEIEHLEDYSNHMDTDGQPYDSEFLESGYHRLGKVSLDEVNLDKDSIEEKINKKEVNHKYGEYKNVLLTDSQYSKLVEDYGETKLLEMIKNLDEGIQMKGYKYKDHNLTIRKWESNSQKKPNYQNYKPNYDKNKWEGEQNFDF